MACTLQYTREISQITQQTSKENGKYIQIPKSSNLVLAFERAVWLLQGKADSDASYIFNAERRRNSHLLVLAEIYIVTFTASQLHSFPKGICGLLTKPQEQL